jgi:hypothetical protein
MLLLVWLVLLLMLVLLMLGQLARHRQGTPVLIPRCVNRRKPRLDLHCFSRLRL